MPASNSVRLRYGQLLPLIYILISHRSEKKARNRQLEKIQQRLDEKDSETD